jgi:hypothetical protein
MKAHPDIKIVCQVCKPLGGNLQLAPGAELEPFQSIKKWLQ